MSQRSIFQPKQQRSQDTQRKLIGALHHCLQEKFFEHISIKELAEHAGVSVGTFYRRFKDKESLLPLLYQDFGDDLHQWLEQLEQQSFADLQHAVDQTCLQTLQFLNDKRSVFRTIHLNSRLHVDLITPEEMIDRKQVYKRIAQVFMRFEQQISARQKQQAAENSVFILISALLDKVLYPELTPAIACDAGANVMAAELPKLILPYLTNN